MTAISVREDGETKVHALLLPRAELQWLSDWLKAGTSIEPEQPRLIARVDDLLEVLAANDRES